MALPSEVLERIFEFSMTRQNAIVDPLPRGCGRTYHHPHACLFKSGQKNGQWVHSETSEKHSMALSAIEAARTANGSATSDDCFNLNVLVLNKGWHKIAKRALFKRNNFIFTNFYALRCFAFHVPHAAARIHHMTMILGNLQGARQVVNGGLEGYLSSLAADIFLANYSKPDFISPVDPLVRDRADFLPSAHIAERFSNLRKITIHLVGWENSGHHQVQRATPHRFLVQKNVVAVKYPKRIREFDLLISKFGSWLVGLSEQGWRAAEIQVTGLEKMEDQELVRGLEQVLVKT